MAQQEHSFDVVSRVDLAEVENALQNARREVATRYDLKGLPIEFVRDEEGLTITAPDDHKVNAAWEILRTHLVKRKVPLANVKPTRDEDAAGGGRRRVVGITNGLPAETAKAIAKAVKDLGLKVRAEIRADEVRVVGVKKDVLQEVVAALRGGDFGLALQFTNFR